MKRNAYERDQYDARRGRAARFMASVFRRGRGPDPNADELTELALSRGEARHPRYPARVSPRSAEIASFRARHAVPLQPGERPHAIPLRPDEEPPQGMQGFPVPQWMLSQWEAKRAQQSQPAGHHDEADQFASPIAAQSDWRNPMHGAE